MHTEPRRQSLRAFYWRMAVRPYLREVASIVALMLAGAALEAIGVGLTVPLLDVLTDQTRAQQSRAVSLMTSAVTSWGFTPSPPVVIFALLVVVSLFFVVRSALLLWSQYETAAIAIKLRRRMKTALFQRFLHARYDEVAQRARGMLVNDINTPPESLTVSMVNLGQFCTGVFNSLLMIGLLLYLSWWATLLMGLVAVLGVQGWRWFADQRAAVHGRTLYELRGHIQKLEVDVIDGLKVVKAHGLEARLVDRLDRMSAGEFRPELSLNLFRYGPTLVNEVIAIGIVLGFGAITFFLPAAGLRLSTLVAFLLAVRRIAPAMAAINASSVNLNKCAKDLEVVEEVLEQLPQERRGGSQVDRVETLHLDEVSFAYPSRPDHQVLDGISAVLRRGTVTALVGSTGAGKSTVASLLLRLYEPQRGRLRINGVNLQGLDLAAWRGHLGYVSQDVFVFNASIYDNITLGDDLPMSRVEWAVRTAQLHDFIASLPDGYRTMVGDRGLRLSGGQCQRLAIARAILRQPDVLIFDEATSALDNLTERAVYNAISTLRREAIVIVIAHRLSTVREADQIVVLQAGRVVEVGTHDLLISRRGVYARLYEEDATQAGSQVVAEAAARS